MLNKLKKLFTCSLVLAITILPSSNVFASENEHSALTQEQIAVLESFNEAIVVNPNASQNKVQSRIRTDNYLYRGSFLAWSKDIIDWDYSNGKVTTSQAWQDRGFVFPNTVRVNGIPSSYTSSYTHEYRASKTIGAGVVSPWGDVNVYESDITDFVSAHGNGSFSYR